MTFSVVCVFYRYMKKIIPNITVLLLAAASGFFVTYGLLSVASAAREGYGVGFEMAVFVASICTMLALFVVSVFLSLKNKTNVMTSVAFLPLALISTIVTLWLVVFMPWQREFRLTLDNNPLLYGGEPVEVLAHVSFLEKSYWMNATEAKASLTSLYNQKAKGSRLIKFSDKRSLQEIIGIDEQTVLAAFGKPVSTTFQDGYSVWTYFPWENHRDWQMKVFLKDGRLVGIGNLN